MIPAVGYSARTEPRRRGVPAAPTRALAVLLALLCLASGASAQAQPPLDPGARVRVTVAGPRPRVQVGTLEALGDSALRLRSGASSRVVPLATVLRLERSRGRRPSVVGGVLGFVLGGAAGGVAGCLANRDSYGVFCGGQSDATVFSGTVLGGAAGAALGAVLLRRERWSPLDVPRAVAYLWGPVARASSTLPNDS